MSGRPNSLPQRFDLLRDERASEPCCPLRLDFDYSWNAGGVVRKAAPSVLLRRCDQSPFHGVAVDVSDDFGAGCFAMDVAVEVALLPELLVIASQFPRGGLLERLEELRQKDRWRFVDEDVKMLGHQDVRIDPGPMPCPGLFEYGLDDVLGVGFCEEWEAMKTTERDEVESLRSLESF